MQVANTLNNTIRILFNPRVEAFKLFDFLIVKSGEERYLAQIIEIYDDKFDASQNVAKLKLFYKITQNDEVMPYDNFTPNKECEIVKINQSEIENFINQDKKTFVFGTNTKNSSALNVQYDFFDKAVVLADKVENACTISLNLAKNLSSEHNVIVADSTGTLELKEAKKLTATKNFKLPLNYTTIDYIFDKCLENASLEFQAVCGEILNEIKKFVKNLQEGFVPFNTFAKVLTEQYKATPYPELKLLLVKVKKYQMNELFAKTKKDNDALLKSISQNPITILDLSGIEAFWQKAYFEYLTSVIENETYLIARVNDENFDVDLINKIYNKKKNIKFIPNVSYSYKKLPSIIQRSKNYILLPSLYQRTDFLNANFALSNLISDECIIFGENTDNFIYLASDYALESQEKRKNYRKIALTVAQNEFGDKEDFNILEEDFEQEAKEDQTSHSKRLIQELSDLNTEESDEKTPQQTNNESSKDFEIDFYQDTLDDNDNEKTPEITEEQDFQENESHSELEIEENEIEIEEKIQANSIPEEEIADELPQIEEIEVKPIEEEIEVEKENYSSNETIIDDETSEKEDFAENDDFAEKIDDSEEEFEELQEETASSEDEEVQNISETTVTDSQNKEELDFSEEELDFFEDEQEENNRLEIQNKKEDDIDLSEIADQSINTSFEKIISAQTQQTPQTTSTEPGVKFDEAIINQTNIRTAENLPIFKEEIKQNGLNFSVGNIISHKKYGRGTVTKTIKYEERQLLQIEFENSGKKLLDPKVADIKLEQ